MIKRLLMGFALLFSLVQASQAIASEASDLASRLATSVQAMVGQVQSNGLTIAAIRAEDETLVVEIDGPAGWRSSRDSKALTDQFLGGFCKYGAFIFERGMKLRVDTTEAAGDKLTGSINDHCPAKIRPHVR